MSKNDRGCITQEIFDKYGFTQTELRLMPYIQYCCINNQCIEPHKIYPEERDIINDWKSKGYISGGASDVICISREFWDIIHDCLWYTYANQLKNNSNSNDSNRKNAEDELSIDIGLEMMED